MQNLNYFSLMDLGYQPIILDLISLLAILSAIMVVISTNPIISVLFLIALFVNVSGYLLLVGIHFIGLSYLLVYIGAVSILFLFVLMLINVRVSELQSNTGNSLPLGYLVGIIFLYTFNRAMPLKSSTGILSMFNSGSSNLDYLDLELLFIESDDLYLVSHKSWEATLAPMTDIASSGSVIYSSHAIWLVLASLILLLAIVGSIAISINTTGSRS